MQYDYVAADLAQCRKLQLDVFGRVRRHPCPHVLDVKGDSVSPPPTVRGLVFVSDTAAVGAVRPDAIGHYPAVMPVRVGDLLQEQVRSRSRLNSSRLRPTRGASTVGGSWGTEPQRQPRYR